MPQNVTVQMPVFFFQISMTQRLFIECGERIAASENITSTQNPSSDCKYQDLWLIPGKLDASCSYESVLSFINFLTYLIFKLKQSMKMQLKLIQDRYNNYSFKTTQKQIFARNIKTIYY